MSQFINVWPAEWKAGPCHQCTACGQVVEGLEGIKNHKCQDPHPDNLGDGKGGLLSNESMRKIREAYTALRQLMDHERGHVLCWFCRGCNRYVGPGDSCHCEDDT